ncbi:nickel ABC transporter permease [Hominifimenecus sp. rT4P-3]|uniref:nickel ABC transporter permease n=1 Tax=Hominifimenecus sp. rT4P-3 TaxID=3242979 RepID=UPI003DA4B68F
MLRYIGKRILMMIPVLLGVTLLVFLLLQLAPGDPAQIILGEDATKEEIAALREEMGLNDSVLVQFGRYVVKLVTKGDMGNSYRSGKPVLESILERYPTTITLAIFGTLIMLIVGIPIGIISAVKQYSWMDNISVAIGMIGVSMPTFWLGLMLILIFSVQLRILPASGFYGPSYWILPAATIGFHAAASLMRTTRSSMLECIRQDYVRTARAKGQREIVVTVHHVLRNAMIPIITVAGMQFGVSLGGAMVIETIFAIPGLGKFVIEAINARDYPIVQGGVLMIALSYSVVNLLVDLLYAAVDPRIKSQFGGKHKAKKIKREDKAGE